MDGELFTEQPNTHHKPSPSWTPPHRGVPSLGSTKSCRLVIRDEEFGEVAAFLAVRDLVRVQGCGDTPAPIARIKLSHSRLAIVD